MPVVIGTVSTVGYKVMYDKSDVVQSRFAVAGLPEFKGTVTAVDTMPFYPSELGALFDLMYQARKATEKTIKEGKTEPNYKTSKQYAEWDKYKGISNRGYHYMGSAESFVEASNAFANAIIELMK